MKHFKVKFGYGANDFYSIPETELDKALRAQINGTIFVCEEGTIAGNNIMAIHPDYNTLMGYNRDYQLTGEDYQEVGADTIKEHQQFLHKTKLEALGGGSQRALGNGA